MQTAEHLYLASACWSASYTSASIRASTLSSSEPLPDATLCASARFARIAFTKEAWYKFADKRGRKAGVRSDGYEGTDLCGESL